MKKAFVIILMICFLFTSCASGPRIHCGTDGMKRLEQQAAMKRMPRIW